MKPIHAIDELLKRLTEHADWCDANEWEIPITMGDDIREAIVFIKHYRAIENTTTLTVRTPNGSNPQAKEFFSCCTLLTR